MSVKTTVYYRWGRYNKTYSAVQSTIPVGSIVSTGIAAIGTTPTWSIDCRYWTSSSYPNITGGYFSTPGQFSNVPLYSSSPALYLLTMDKGNYYAFANTDYQSTSSVIYYARDGHTSCEFGTNGGMYTLNPRHYPIVKIGLTAAVGSFNQYVYSLSGGAYPNGSFSGNYYYQNRTENTLSSVEAPDMAFYNAAIVVSWSANTDAASYSLDRKVDGGSWEPVSGAQGLTETAFTDTAPAAGTALSYRVRVNLGGSDLAAESETVYLLSNDTLSISGTDGNLGSLSGDVTYAVSTDTGNPITVTETANGVLLRTFTAPSGTVNCISVLDLLTGAGSIVITATVATDSGQVAVIRTWQYTKQAHAWPSSGDVAQLVQGGRSLWPTTLAEAVRTTGGPWGGSLDKALEKLAPLMAAGAKIATGSYVGTGTYGVSNPCNLTFPFTPIWGMFYQLCNEYGQVNQTGTMTTLVPEAPQINTGTFGTPLTGQIIAKNYFVSVNSTFSGNTLTWYSNTELNQYNISGVTYVYFVIGQ